MSKDPIQLESGELACGTCKIELTAALVPAFMDKKIFGYVDGISCKECGYGLMTEQGYDDFEKALQGDVTDNISFTRSDETYFGHNTNETGMLYVSTE